MSMQLNPSEISELIKERIKDFDAGAEARTEGTVVSLTDGICRIHGLADAMQGEMLEFPNDTFGLALNLEQDSVGAVVLGDYEHIVEGDTVKCTGRILEVPIGPGLLGRVVDSLGEAIDGKGPIDTAYPAPIESLAPRVITRQSVSQPVQTGLKAIDSMVQLTSVELHDWFAEPALEPATHSRWLELAARGEGARVARGEDHRRVGEQVEARRPPLVEEGHDLLLAVGLAQQPRVAAQLALLLRDEPGRDKKVAER